MLFFGLNRAQIGHCATRSYIPIILRHTSLSILSPFFLSTMRNMSYRKPVPTYVPSPPSSPRQSILPPSTLEVPPVRIYFFCILLFLEPYCLLLAATQLAWGFRPSWDASSKVECWINHWGIYWTGHDRAGLISRGKSQGTSVSMLLIMRVMFFECLVRQLNCLWRPRHSINFKCSMDAKTSFAPSMRY